MDIDYKKLIIDLSVVFGLFMLFEIMVHYTDIYLFFPMMIFNVIYLGVFNLFTKRGVLENVDIFMIEKLSNFPKMMVMSTLGFIFITIAFIKLKIK